MVPVPERPDDRAAPVAAYPPQPAAPRPPYRPPVGLPLGKQRRLGGLVVSVALHLLIILLLVVPFTSPELRAVILGAGGIGPAGGGGGGRGGRGGGAKTERLTFVNVAPPPPPPATTAPTPPVLPPPPPPPEPKPAVKPDPQPQPLTSSAQASGDAAAATTGTGSGTGGDGSGGAGPGSGGGVGSGVGTGRGSAVGPGTGGGPGTIYPPSPTELFLPPMPTPGKVKGTEIVVQFDVDSTGRVLDFEFTPTKDGAYNRKLREALAAIRFRPAVDATGQPVRAKAVLTYTI
jgi:hypothetical protein